MSKQTLNKNTPLMSYALAMTLFCLLVTWGIESLANELFRLA